jgi:hypothetical protein
MDYAPGTGTPFTRCTGLDLIGKNSYHRHVNILLQALASPSSSSPISTIFL